MMDKLIVDRYRRPEDSTFRYTANVHVAAVMDRATALEHPATEQWMVDSLLERLIADLILFRQSGGKVVVKTHGDET